MKKLKYALIYILSLVLAVALTLVGTVAFLQDEEGSVNVMTVGNVHIALHEYERAMNEDGTYKTATVNGKESYVLQPFTQAKPLYPSTELDANGELYNFGAGNWDSTMVRMSQVGSHGSMQVFESKLAVDKFVTVENTGKSDAYVRVLVAFEIGDVAEAEFENIIGVSAFMIDQGVWTVNDIGIAEINGNNYYISEYIYKGGAHVGGVHANGVLPAGDTTYACLAQVYMKGTATNEDVEALDGNDNGTYEILTFAQAVQTNGFNDPKTALDAAFGAISQNNIANLPWDANFSASSTTKASNDEAFAAAINRNDAVIVIDLEKDVNFNVSDAYIKVGGEDTEKIIINGNGNTLNLYTTYWSRINTVNPDAVLVLNNVNVTSTQTSGTWDSYDLTFVCEVEANNVTFLKAVALENDATFNNVKILERNGDYYALWITAEGQTVTLNNVEINTVAATKASASIATQGRGIKIDDQYVEDPAKVTLNVNGAKFTTGKKAAIMVKTTGGAEINLKNVDILGVKADFVNPVWIDEDLGADAASCAKIVVNGGSKIVEGEAITEGYDAFLVTDPSAAAETFKNVTNGDVVYFGSGVYPMTNLQGKEVTIIGNGETSIPVTKIGTGGENCDYSFDGSNVTFENVVITTNSSTYIGYARCKATYNNCTFNGTFTTYDNSVFNNCTFNVSGDVYNLWTWGAPNVTLKDCTFNSDGKAVLLYGTANTNLVVDGCTFNDKGGLTDKKAAIEVGNDYGVSYTLTVNNTVVNGYEVNDKGTYTGTTIYGNKNSMPADKLVVTIDGVDVSGKIVLATAVDMVAFANKVNVENNSFSGKTITVIADIDLAGIEWIPVGQTGATQFEGIFDGNGHVISNMTVNNTNTSKYCSSGLFGWLNGTVKNVVLDKASVTGHHLVGGIVGYVERGTVEGCVVKNSTFNCVSANDDANGDKCGAVAGQIGADSGKVTNCSAEKCTVTAGRDAGQVVGAALGALAANVTGCTATDVTVTANGTSTGANINNTVIGRK